MSRDPLREPRFGDVFQRGAWAMKVLYIRSLGPAVGDDWLGLALDWEFDPRAQQWMKLDEKWEFVETITVHAIGGVMPPTDFSGMSYANALRAMSIYGRIRIDEVDS